VSLTALIIVRVVGRCILDSSSTEAHVNIANYGDTPPIEGMYSELTLDRIKGDDNGRA
jgi:hypothetical protein